MILRCYASDGVTDDRGHHHLSIPLVLGVSAAIVAGIAIRFAALRSSLWLDEFSTLWAVESDFQTMAHRVPQVMGQSPFYFAFAWASIHALGESEWALRLPSLLAGGLGALVVGWAAAASGVRKAGVWSSVLFWLSYPATWESVDARPYALAIGMAALATGAFLRVTRTGARLHRLLWVLGAVGVVWAHYIFAPLIAGLVLAYLLRPDLRRAYRPGALIVDGIVASVLMIPAWPQAWTILSAPAAQQWMFSPKYLGVIGLIAPFAVAAVMPLRRRDHVLGEADTTAALWLAIATQLVALETASLFGLDVMASRYAVVAIVPLAILAGRKLARFRRADLVAPLSAYVAITGVTFAANRQVCGSLSGAGCQDWRAAVATTAQAWQQRPGTLVLYRSGNAEDDLTPGHPTWPATLAPLRGPGHSAPDWPIALLTYTWRGTARSSYFETTLRPQLQGQSAFFMLCLTSSEPGTDGYCADTARWIANTWPGEFKVSSLGAFRQLVVLRFDRSGGP